MSGIVDRFLVLSCSFIFMLGQVPDLESVPPVLVAITLSALNGLLGSPLFLIFSFLLYLGAISVWVNLAFFLPLLAYDLFLVYYRQGQKYWLLAVPVLLLVSFRSFPLRLALLLSVCLAVAAVLAQRNVVLQSCQEEAKRLRDASWEKTMLLKESKRELMEKRDYEARVALLKERSRIAREIHDHVGHLLSRSILQIGALLISDKQAAQSLTAIEDTLSQAMDRIRLSVHGLYEQSLDLRTQVEILVDNFTFCPIRLDYKLKSKPGKTIENCFLAIVKEGLNNVIRHSNATQVVLTLLEHPGFYQLVLQDNGTKFKKGEGGLGLRSMEDRLGSLGGIFRADYQGGFRIFISVPKQ